MPVYQCIRLRHKIFPHKPINHVIVVIHDFLTLRTGLIFVKIWDLGKLLIYMLRATSPCYLNCKLFYYLVAVASFIYILLNEDLLVLESYVHTLHVSNKRKF